MTLATRALRRSAVGDAHKEEILIGARGSSSRRSLDMPRHTFDKRAVTKGSVVTLKRAFNQGQLTYVAPVTVEGQTLYVQADTGSSDFWLASDKCGTPSCQSKEGYDITLFRDDTGLETGESVQISYLRGSAAGPIVSSNVTFANATIPNQAFLTAEDVEAEPLGAMQASGVMGLALPMDSLIQSQLSTRTTGLNNSINDSSRTGSVLPGLWLDAEQGQRFFGLGLQRLPSDGGNGDSTITFGDYDPAYLPADQQSQVVWQPVVPDQDGTITKWKTSITDFRLNVNGTQIQVPLSRTGAIGAATALLSTGAPLNYANPSFLNAMYGAYNVGPSADGSGSYFVECGLQMDVTLVVGGVEVPIHPLDSSLKYSSMVGNANDGCIGAFQSFSDEVDIDSVGANIVLGAPFLRSVYSLYSCDPNPRNTTQTGWCSNPWIGLFPLYNQTQNYETAESDFQKVRVLGQQLGDNSAVDGATTKSSGFSSGAKIAVGVICGFLGILIVMAGLLLWLKRRRAKMEPEEVADSPSFAVDDEKDPISGSVDWKKLSENERQKARELAMLHGHFIEDGDGTGRASPMSSTAQPDGDWDISSKGYWEARAIRNDYLKRQRDQDSSAAARSLSTAVDSERDPTMHGVEVHEMASASSSQHMMTPPLSPYKDLPDTPDQPRTF